MLEPSAINKVPPPKPTPDPLIAIRDLKVHLSLGRGRIVKAVDGVTIDIYQGETLGLGGRVGLWQVNAGRANISLHN